MTLPSIRLEDVPKPWRPTFSVIAFFLVAGGSVLLFLAWVRAEARAEARAEVRAVREADLAQFRQTALEAAKEGGRLAVIESVQPVLLELQRNAGRLEAHEAWDHRSQNENERRLETLERRK